MNTRRRPSGGGSSPSSRHRDARGIVEIQLRLREDVARLDEARPVVFGQLARTQLRAADQRLGGRARGPESCSFDISSEKNATRLPQVIETCRAMLSAKLVLPMPGRAPTMMRSERFRPVIVLSSSRMPVGMPRYRSLSGEFSRSSRSNVSKRISLRRCRPVMLFAAPDVENALLGRVEQERARSCPQRVVRNNRAPPGSACARRICRGRSRSIPRRSKCSARAARAASGTPCRSPRRTYPPRAAARAA